MICLTSSGKWLIWKVKVEYLVFCKNIYALIEEDKDIPIDIFDAYLKKFDCKATSSSGLMIVCFSLWKIRNQHLLSNKNSKSCMRGKQQVIRFFC